MAWATRETIAIFALMIIVLLFGTWQIIKLITIGKDFNNTSKKIRENETAETLKAYLLEDNAESANPFSIESLKATFEEYRKDLLHTVKLDISSPYKDITNYFHAEYIDSISFGTICELIPGAMTGLGLLGTFIGLVYGIKGLDVNSTDGLLNGINGLLKGMNTAFLTSIVGVIASLLFSFIYKGVNSFVLREMECFIDAFQEKNLDGGDSCPENILLNYQHQQTETLKSFADEVAISISQCMIDILAPVTTKMETTIEEFANVASSKQKEGLELVVKEFIRSMNDAIGGQFDALGNTIQELCEWQKNSIIQMQAIVNGICDTSTEIEKINEISRQTVIEMNRFMEKVNDLQTSINEELDQVRQQIEIANTINNRNSAYIQQLVEYEKHITSLADSVRCEAEDAHKAVALLQQNCEAQIKALSTAAQQEVGTISESIKVLSHQHLQSVSVAAQEEMRKLANLSTQLTDLFDREMDAINNIVKDLNETYETQIQKLSDTAQGEMITISESTTVLAETSHQQIQATNDFVDFVKQQNQIFIEAVKQEVSEITNLASQTTLALNHAAESIEIATQSLDKNLDTVLDRTFTAFDTGLAEITQHLSGTIADVRDTTESVPHLIAKAQKQYDSILNTLSIQTQEYVNTMKSLTEDVQRNLNSNGGSSK